MGTHDAVDWPLFTWLRMPGFEVTFGVRLDALAWMLFALTTVVMLLVLSAWPKGTSRRWLWLACFGVLLTNFAGNLGQVFFGWTISAWASSELARRVGQKNLPFRPVWLVQRISDMALLAGCGLIWMHVGLSLEFSALTPEAVGALRPELVESIALCLLVGVLGRCAQLPFTVWLETEAGFAAQAGNSMTKLSEEMVGLWNVPDGHQVAERLKADPSNRWHEPDGDSVPPTVLAWWLCAAFLPVGIGLLIRFESLFALASHTRLLMVAVGGFTLLVCSSNAAAQNNWSRVLSQIAVGQCGLVLVGLGLGHADGDKVWLLFLWQSVMVGVLLVATRPESHQRFSRAAMLAVLSLASGIWGRHGVTNLIWDHCGFVANEAEMQAAESGSLVFGSTESRVWTLVIVLICVAEFLTSFALLRAWFSDRRRRPDRERASQSLSWGLWLTVGCLLIGGLVLGMTVLERPSYGVGSLLVGVGPLLPLSAAGAVLAWWMYSQPSSLPEKVSAAMGPFARLSRNRFYWDDLYFLLFVHPASVIGEWLVWLDERVFGRAPRSWRNSAANFVGESAEPLSGGSPRIGALTTVGSVVVLAWMLLWLRS